MKKTVYKNKLIKIIKNIDCKYYNLKENEIVLVKCVKYKKDFKIIKESGDIANAFISQVELLPDDQQDENLIYKYLESYKNKFHDNQKEGVPWIIKVYDISENKKTVFVYNLAGKYNSIPLKIIPGTPYDVLLKSKENDAFISINIPLWFYKKITKNNENSLC